MNLENCIHKGNGKNVYVIDKKAVKIFDSGYSKTDVLYEALNTCRAEDAGMNIPSILDVSYDGSQWSITTEYIEGNTLKTLIQENPDKIDIYIDKMVDLQLEVNEKQNPLLVKLKDKLSRQINELTIINDSIKYELCTKLESMPKHTKLCHGDFNPENIIVDSSDTFHIVDWVHATQGNASADVALTYLQLALRNETIAEKYMKCFSSKTSTSISYLKQWLPIVAAARLTKNIPIEKELLLRWVDIAEFN